MPGFQAQGAHAQNLWVHVPRQSANETKPTKLLVLLRCGCGTAVASIFGLTVIRNTTPGNTGSYERRSFHPFPTANRCHAMNGGRPDD
jgi:hypothetical protein